MSWGAEQQFGSAKAVQDTNIQNLLLERYGQQWVAVTTKGVAGAPVAGFSTKTLSPGFNSTSAISDSAC